MSILKDEFNLKSNVPSLKAQPRIIQAMFSQIVKLQAESLVVTEMVASRFAESDGVEKQGLHDQINNRTQELFLELMAFYQGK